MSWKFVKINKLFLAFIITAVAVVSFWLGGKMFVWFHTDLVVDHVVTYTVSSGDTLSGIASAYKMDGEKDYRRQMAEIREMNNLNGDYDIHSGQVLQIPVFIHVVK